MKRRAISFLTALALCLSLCPPQALAAGREPDTGLCSHHPVHTEECGYIPPTPGQDCTHEHDESCYVTQTLCVHQHTEECYSGEEPSLCTHECSEASGCVTRTLDCQHVHDESCGYVPEDAGAPCTFDCRVCPLEDLIAQLPASVTPDNRSQVESQLREILALYTELTDEEQEQLDLSRCLDLQAQLDPANTPAVIGSTVTMTEDGGDTAIYSVPHSLVYNTQEFTYTATRTSAFQVQSGGVLSLQGSGAVVSKKGSGVEVLAGGTLYVDGPAVKGTTYGLDIASGAEVELSGGTFTGSTAAIRTANGDFAALLASGYAFFDASGNPVRPADAASEKTLVVKECTDHVYHYTHIQGKPAHSWTCEVCGTTVASEPCTFEFDEDGWAECVCGDTIQIVVDERSLGDLVYNSTEQEANVTLTVKLGDGTVLTENKDYTVSYTTSIDVGEITVTVTGITYNGTFTKTYEVTQDQPGIEWDDTTCSVDYDSSGKPVDPSDLPNITITIKAPNNEDLHKFIEYSYRTADSGEDFTPGLPVNAGKYEVKASLPEQQNYKAAETDPCLTLTINKIYAVITAPEATKPVYNGTSQELVTAGTMETGAVENGAVMKFAQSEDGPYSTDIPVGTNAGDYQVWYKVEDTENYIGSAGAIEIEDVLIQRKPVKPVVELSYYTCLYDGGEKEPKVTVKDGETELPNTEYSVTYADNRNVSTTANPAKVTVEDKVGGNYEIEKTEVTFRITAMNQATLSITEKPNTVTYGDQFTLSTLGGSGNGEVTWEITSGKDTVAKVDQASGLVTVKGTGTATVQATKSGTYNGVTNYEEAIAVWTFTAAQKPVVAVVTADDKTYDGSDEATVRAVVEQGVLAGDEIKITGLTGAFDDANAGTNKPVTVDKTGAQIAGTNSEHYAVTYSSAAVTANINKAPTSVAAPPSAQTLIYNGTEQELVSAGAVVITGVLPGDSADVQLEYALSETGPYSTAVPKAANAGDYEVWYRVKETSNYTGTTAQKVSVPISKKTVNPVIDLHPTTFEYDGTAKEPAVTVEDGNGNEIPNTEYTVAYSNNINVGTKATVTVTAKDDGNYKFGTANSAAATFTITQKKAQVVTAPEPAGDPLTFTNRALKLVIAGTASGGTMVYSVDDPNGTYDSAIPTATNAGTYKVYYKVKGDGNHADSDVDPDTYVEVTIIPKTVVATDATIELQPDDDMNPDGTYTYDGTAKKPKVVVKDGGTEIHESEYNVTYFNNKNAGIASIRITNQSGGNYAVTGSTEFIIVQADITFSRDPAANIITYDGKPHELLTEGITEGGTVLYALNSKTSIYSDAIPTETEAGTYTVWYKVEADSNHNDFAPQSVDVTILPKQLTSVTIELSPNAFEYDGKPHMPTVTVKDGNTEIPASEYTVSCSPATPVNEDTYTITIGDVAGGNYDLSGVTTTATFAIGKTAQAALAITGQPAAVNYGDSFQLGTSGGSGDGAVAWSVTGPATVDRTTGTVTVTGVGDVTVTATKAAADNYFEAIANWSFTAEPKPVTATVTVADKVYDGNTSATIDPITIPGLESGDTVTVNGLTAAFTDANVGTGKKVILDHSEATVGGTDASKYAVSYPASATANITRATTTITTDPASKAPLTYTGQPQALVSAGISDFGDIVYSLDGTDFSTAIPTGTDAGDYTVYYKVVGNANYTDVDEDSVTVAIDPKTVVNPTVIVSPSSFVYDGSKKEPVITVKDVNTEISSDQYTVTWNPSGLTAAGRYTATIASIPGKNYTFTDQATVDIVEASQNALTIMGTPSRVFYGDTITTLYTMGGTGNGTVKWSIETAGAKSSIDPDTGKLEVKDTGTIMVKAARTVSSNYETVEAVWSVTVEPKPVLAVVTVADKVYDDGDTSATVTSAVVSASDLVPGDTVTIDKTKFTADFQDGNVGTNKTVILDSSRVTVSWDTSKYTVSYPSTATASITPKPVTVSVTLKDDDLKTDANGTQYFDYDGTAKTPAVTVTDVADGTEIPASEYTVAYSSNKNAGTATVTVTARMGGNYTFDNAPPVTATFEIRKAAAVLTSPPKANDLTYDGTMQDLLTAGTATGGTVWYSWTESGPYEETILQKDAAGTYTVYYKVKGDDNHSDTAPVKVSVTIKQKTVISPVVTLDTDSYQDEYDGTEKTPAVTQVEDRGTVIPSTEYTVTYSDNINAGTATVHIVNANGGNYIVSGSATFEITKAPAKFAPEPSANSLVYNGTAQELVTAGASQDGTVVYSLNGGAYSTEIPTGTNRGDYEVSAKVLGGPNHVDSDVKTYTATIGQNTVSKPTIKLSDTFFPYNSSQQKPTVEVLDGQGRLIPENEYTVSITDENGNPANAVDVGKYTITVTASGNYVIQSNNTAEFEIGPADQETIAITGMRDRVYYGDVIQLGVTGGTGSGTVTWSVTDAAGDPISDITIYQNGLLEVKDTGGPVTVTAKRSAGDNYNEMSATWVFYAYKKPVTAVLTGVDRPYDPGITAAGVKAEIAPGDLVDGDSISIPDLTGTFADANVGTNKKVTVTTSPAPTVTGTNSGKYDITYPTSTTASITPAAARVTVDPAAQTLTYDGSYQELVTAGDVTGGYMAYSLNGVDYSLNIPTAIDAGSYRVWYKALASENYKDSAAKSVVVTIGPKVVNAPDVTVTCSPSKIPYDGMEKTPTVIVTDEAGREIPGSEYTVEFDSGRVEKGNYMVTVTDKDGGNYKFTTATGSFDIVEASGEQLTIITDKSTNVCYGDTFVLNARGGTGAITWSITDGDGVATIDEKGVVTVTGLGSFTVTAQKDGNSGYEGFNTDSMSFYADRKPIALVVTAEDKDYDGTPDVKLTAAWNPGLVGNDGDNIEVTVSGHFATASVGTNKQVIVDYTITGGDTSKYDITYPAATASIYKVDAELEDRPEEATGLVYDGNPHELLTSGGTTKNGIGVVEYCLSENGEYSTAIPKVADAGIYTVWYKVAGSANYTGVDAASKVVTIAKAETTVTVDPTADSVTAGETLSQSALSGGQASDKAGGSVPGSFAWTDGTIVPVNGQSYEVTFTPDDAVNYKTATVQVSVTVNPPAADGDDSTSGDGTGSDDSTGSGDNTGDSSTNGGGSGTGSNSSGSNSSPSAGSSSPAVSAPSAASVPAQASVQNDTATAVLSTAAGDALVAEAVANQSAAVVIKPEIAGDVTKAEVSIPAATVSRIRSETSADLTVSTPVADVTIPNAALDALSGEGGSVSVVTEQMDGAIAVTLRANGSTVEEIPGGLTLTVPVEDAGPGTVAVLVHEDGTRETIRKSVAEDGTMNIPLSGSATVEIVDNSKEFDDVPEESWAADAVAFASAHELFNGTSETTFSPDEPMSRAMLATVLYNLEGRPAQEVTDEFSDIGSGDWYAEGVSWATENGITNGYGNGAFGPDENVTREQFAVMLWRYAGSPAPESDELGFTDADQASSYALEALCWAAEKGILNGYGNGQLDPAGLATRAQAAQLLKNFMENA